MGSAARDFDFEIVEGKISSTRGAKIKQRWIPKEWRSEYESIVALSCTGLSNSAIGERFGYTKEHISNILRTPEGMKLKQIIATRLREHNTNSVPERLARIQDHALKNLEKVIIDRADDLAEASPFALFDRSMQMLKMGGIVKDQSTPAPLVGNGGTVIGSQNNTQVNIFTSDAIKSMTDAMRESNEVKLLHGEVSGSIDHG